MADKGKDLTSFDVVKIVRKLSGERVIGHAGTLDKLATGLMILALGEATKFLEYLIGCDKEYDVLARFGVVSETYDAEGPLKAMTVEKFKKFTEVSGKNLEEIIKKNFLGEIGQIPPKYSALKIAGKRASDRVRMGEQIAMKERKIRIDEFKILNFNWPEVKFRVRCGSGTYIRSLIHDLGRQIGCGAYVLQLRRMRINSWKVDDSKVLGISGDFKFINENIDQYLISIEDFVEKFDSIIITDEEFVDLSNGKAVAGREAVRSVPTVALYNRKVVGIIENVLNNSGLKFRKRIH